MDKKVWLLVVAAPAEARAVLRGLGADESLAEQPWRAHKAGGFDVLVTGIGKTNAAGAVGRVLEPARHGAVVSVGVAGALPASGLELGAVVAASASVYADEGLETPEGFTDCAGMGFKLGPFPGSSVPADPGVLGVLGLLADVVGPVATVSTCSGTDALARTVRERTGALAECMEGAAVAHVAVRVGVACGELRVISNTCGDRAPQRWDLNGALSKLGAVIGRLSREGVGTSGGR